MLFWAYWRKRDREALYLLEMSIFKQPSLRLAPPLWHKGIELVGRWRSIPKQCDRDASLIENSSAAAL
jgi:hypothetical protein